MNTSQGPMGKHGTRQNHGNAKYMSNKGDRSRSEEKHGSQSRKQSNVIQNQMDTTKWIAITETISVISVTMVLHANQIDSSLQLLYQGSAWPATHIWHFTAQSKPFPTTDRFSNLSESMDTA